jgi:2-hydroxy-6-oxonona-2,4-dienedioate hydrolase
VPASPRPIVFLHGLGVSARYMLPTFQLLASEYKVFAPEMPGFGRSDKPKHVCDVPELADVLAEWMMAVGLPSATFLGNSLGCQVIVDLAVRHPRRVDNAILVGPTVDTRDRTMPRQLWRGFCDLIHEPWSLWPILARDYLATGTRRMVRTFRCALEDPVEKKFPLIRCPTLIVRGSRDTVVPARWVDELAALLPESRVVTIAGATHATNYSAPGELVRAVNSFLNEYGRFPQADP